MSVLEVKGLTKVYQSKGSVATTALNDINFKIEEARICRNYGSFRERENNAFKFISNN